MPENSSNTTVTNSSESEGMNSGSLLLFVLRILIASCTILLNILVFTILVKKRVHCRNYSNLFLVSLILASAIGGVSALAFSLQQVIPHNFVLCILFINDLEVTCFIILMNLLFINLDQLCKMEYPLRYLSCVTSKVVKVCLVISWTLPFVLQFSVFFSDDSNYGYCMQNIYEPVSKAYYLYGILGNYIIPVLILGTVQLRIIYIVLKRRKAFAGAHRNHRRPRQTEYLKPTIITAAILFGTHFVTNTPAHILITLSMIKPDEYPIGDYGLFNICMSLAYLNFVLIPILYAMRFKEVRDLARCKVLQSGKRENSRRQSTCISTNL